jgi:hypothetical protein
MLPDGFYAGAAFEVVPILIFSGSKSYEILVA